MNHHWNASRIPTNELAQEGSLTPKHHDDGELQKLQLPSSGHYLYQDTPQDEHDGIIKRILLQPGLEDHCIEDDYEMAQAALSSAVSSTRTLPYTSESSSSSVLMNATSNAYNSWTQIGEDIAPSYYEKRCYNDATFGRSYSDLTQEKLNHLL